MIHLATLSAASNGPFYTNADTFDIFPTPEMPYYIVVEVDAAALEAQKFRDAVEEVIDPRLGLVQ